jgi:hypothetical protein
MKKLAGIVLASALVFVALSGSAKKAQAAGWFNCQATDVQELSNNGTPLLMVECSNNFATGVNATAIQVNTATAGQPARFTAMANAAVLAGRKFRVWMTDTVCTNYNNCRIATSWSLYTL